MIRVGRPPRGYLPSSMSIRPRECYQFNAQIEQNHVEGENSHGNKAVQPFQVRQ
jgi:hypothetical protein